MTDYVFFVLALFVCVASVAVVVAANPLYSALSLALSMIGMAALFFRLDAHFIAAVQLIVYAGAVMVLFVMVLMLFDVKHELKTFSRGVVSGGLKIVSAGLMCGIVMGAALLSTRQVMPVGGDVTWAPAEITRDVAVLLFTKYLFGFEAMGVLLLVIAIGAVALSRVRGGTHARPD